MPKPVTEKLLDKFIEENVDADWYWDGLSDGEAVKEAKAKFKAQLQNLIKAEVEEAVIVGQLKVLNDLLAWIGLHKADKDMIWESIEHMRDSIIQKDQDRLAQLNKLKEQK